MAEPFKATAFSQALMARIAQRGYTMREVAEATGTSLATISRIANGVTPFPSVKVFSSLVDWMGVSADDFVVRKGPWPPAR